MEDAPVRGHEAGLANSGDRYSAAAEPGIRTFLIADIRGYTSFTHERGDEAAGGLAEQFAAVTDQIVTAYDGVVLELRGDEALVVFASARQAIRAAVALQRSFTETARDGKFSLPVGIGLDAGEAVPVRGGFRGASLNRAARLCSLAKPGEILATPEVVHLASRVDGTRFRSYGQVHMKGLPRPLDVIAIEGEDVVTSTPTKRGIRTSRTFLDRLRRVRPPPRRPRLVLLAVVGAFAILAVAAVAPSLLPPSAETTSQTEDNAVAPHSVKPVAPDLSATLVLVPDFEPKSQQAQYMIPDGTARPPDLPAGLEQQPSITSLGSTAYTRWHDSRGGVPQGRQTVRLVLTGRAEAPVIITQIRPFVIARRPPLRGWRFLPEQGAGVSVRFVEANLDCPAQPALLLIPDAKTGQIIRRTTSIDLLVSRSEVEELEVTVYSYSSYVRWGLQVTYVSQGQVNTLRVTDPGLHVTGEAPGTLRTYTYFPSPRGVELPGPTGLVRTPQFDATSADIRYLTSFASKLCR